MNRYKTITLGSALLAVLTIAPSSLAAQPPGSGGHPGGGPFGSGRGGGEFIAERLDLSEGQREEIRTIREAYSEDVEHFEDAMRSARENLSEKIEADVFDEAEIRLAASRVATVAADQAVLRAKISHEVRTVLTPEQIAEGRALRERMRGFMAERHGKGHRGYRGQRGQRGQRSQDPLDAPADPEGR